MFFVCHDGILNKDLIVHANVWVWSINPENLSRDLVIVMQAVYVLLVSTDGMSFTRRLLSLWIALNRMIEVEARMEPSEEELEVKLPLEEVDEEEEKEVLFTFKKE